MLVGSWNLSEDGNGQTPLDPPILDPLIRRAQLTARLNEDEVVAYELVSRIIRTPSNPCGGIVTSQVASRLRWNIMWDFTSEEASRLRWKKPDDQKRFSFDTTQPVTLSLASSGW